MIAEPLIIVMTFDAEDDYFDTSICGPVRSTHAWKGIEEGIPIIDRMLSNIRDSSGGRAHATWFVRCDDQIMSDTGDRAYLLRKYRDCWRHHQDLGDEIGFHPHLYTQSDGKWTQATDDAAVEEQLRASFKAMEDVGFSAKVSRIGECYSSNTVMQTLDSLHLVCDSTALPGRMRQDAMRHFDWSITSNAPYRPSASDYRVSGSDSLRLLEVPMTAVRTLASYDKAPVMRYVDLSFYSHVLEKGLSQTIASLRALVTVNHPSTILPDMIDKPHGLLSFSSDEFESNLKMIVDLCERQGRSYRFATLSQYASLCRRCSNA